MYVCMYVICMFINICVCMHVKQINKYFYIYMYIFMYKYTYIYTYV